MSSLVGQCSRPVLTGIHPGLSSLRREKLEELNQACWLFSSPSSFWVISNLSLACFSSSPVMVSNVYTIRAPPSLQRYREEPTPPPTSSGGSLVPGDPTVAPCYLVLAHSLSFPLIFEELTFEIYLCLRQASSHHPIGLSTGASVGLGRKEL